ncbi:WXG100 family type VII secretion target [Mycolicibacterium aubagnense]|uniref:ESAT-6-like protein n=1 Tax=Mycolicibacterium aubagnense TaxID=319707 RepID=A0ABN5YXG3_9MYCO|nr:WXG100 family type VII secretion target [Mycolicibacterium aubagnense]TLH70747.1 WXG100 family type VII secretion target [Mycolicibacterium aubagnense]BBX85601.1 ESAT-6-like protein EsxA [Mycolicibacterium aubagnense]
MSGAQNWNFAGIEGSAGDLAGAVSTTQGLLDEGKASLAKLASVWGGSGSEAYQAVQQRWDNTAMELNNALQSLGHAVSEAGGTMQGTEHGVTGMFG